MNIDKASAVKASSPDSPSQASSSHPGLLAAQSHDPGAKSAPVLDNDADLEPEEMSPVPLTPGQTGTMLEPEVNGPLPPAAQQLTEEQRRILSQKTGLDFGLDLFDSQEVERYFAYYTGPARESFARWLKRAQTQLPYVRESLAKNGLPQDLAMLPFAESGYNCYAYSWAGAGGMWQFMPYTARKYGLTVDWWLDERRDPRMATEAAARYLSFLNDMFGDWYLALAAYNAGEGKISRALEATDAEDFLDLVSQNNRLNRVMRLKAETQHYVPKFVAITKIFQNLEALGFEPIDWNVAPKLETVKVPGGTDLLALAKAGGMNWEQFHQLNPAFRRLVSPPNRQVVVAIPVNKKAPMLAYLEDPSARPHAGFIAHEVTKGDSLRKLARRYHVPQEIICQVNGAAAKDLQPGTQLMVPLSSTGEAVPSSPAVVQQQRNTRRIAASRANYVVRKRDSAWSISKKFNLSVKTLVEANGLSSAKEIRPGMRLNIPDATEQATKKTRAQAARTREQVIREPVTRESAPHEQATREQVTRYTVRQGDTIYSLSRRFGVTADALRSWNKIKGTDLRAGDSIKVYQ